MTDKRDAKHPDVLPPEAQREVLDAVVPDRPMQVRATENCYYGDVYYKVGDEFTITKTSDFVPDYMEKVEPEKEPKGEKTHKEE